MINRSDKKLPSRPKVVDGRTRFINLPKIQKEIQRRREKKSKVKLLCLSFFSICLIGVGSILIPTKSAKSEKMTKAKVVVTKNVASSEDQTFRPLKAPVAPEPVTNYVSSYASPEPDQVSGEAYEPYSGTNSDNAYDPYFEDVGRYLAHEEEPNMPNPEEEAHPAN